MNLLHQTQQIHYKTTMSKWTQMEYFNYQIFHNINHRRQTMDRIYTLIPNTCYILQHLLLMSIIHSPIQYVIVCSILLTMTGKGLPLLYGWKQKVGNVLYNHTSKITSFLCGNLFSKHS